VVIDKVSYRVGTLKIAKALKGANGLTHVRIGVVMPVVVPPVPGQPINTRAIRPNPFQVNLEEGMEGCFFLTPHATENVYFPAPLAIPLLKKNESYAKEMALIEKTVNILSEPMKALKSDKVEERGMAAATLITAYRTPLNPRGKSIETKLEPIALEESKLILQAIGEQDWKKFNPELGVLPWQSYFFQLGANETTGFMAPKFTGQPNYNDLVQEAAKAWIAKNQDMFRLQRYVEVMK